jgi:hypothetical protein
MWRMRTHGPLRRHFEQNDGRLIHKWMHYFTIYERHFGPYRRRRPVVLEIGVSQGGSLQMWRRYFGRRSTIIGVDIDERVAALEEPGVHIRVGDQSDTDFLRSLADEWGPFDIVIDDGSHIPQHQRASMEALWEHLKIGGVYLVEDLHTSYWPEYGGGLRVEPSFIEWVKARIDDVNAYHSRQPEFEATNWTRSIAGIHLYDSVAVFDKAEVPPPTVRMTGLPAFGTIYGHDAEVFIDETHQRQLLSLGSPRARVRRLLRDPVRTTRRVCERLLARRRGRA